MEQLLKEGAEIEERLKFLGYDKVFFGEELSKEWSIQFHSKETEDKIWKRRGTWEKENVGDITVLAFKSGPIKGNLLTCITLLRESQLGALAGDVSLWDVRTLSPTQRQIHYCSVFPRPMEKRDFCILEHTGIAADGSVILLNYHAGTTGCIQEKFTDRDVTVDSDQLNNFENSSYIHGNVHFSVYHLQKLDEEHFTLYRYFCLDMKLSWFFPRTVQDKALVDVFKQNIMWIRRKLKEYKTTKDLPEEYQQILENDKIYSLLDENLQC